ncbi:MAG: hypothetical protein K8I27_12705, partial [Planctomycetes bacterium]|nr:hypothetical protein [Planctomycetota bacterium]
MRSFVAVASLFGAILCGCVAKTDPVERPPFPETKRSRIDYHINNLEINEALFKRATVTDFDGLPLNLPPWAQSAILSGGRLIDPRNGRALSAVANHRGNFSIPSHQWEEADNDWLFVQPVDVSTGVGLDKPALCTTNAAGEVLVTLRDRSGREVWTRNTGLVKGRSDDFEVVVSSECILLHHESTLLALGWVDGGVLWTAYGCPGQLEAGNKYVATYEHKREHVEVRILDASSGRPATAFRFRASEPPADQVRFALNQGRWWFIHGYYHDAYSTLYDMNGNEL